jgi:hypothetical protein
MLRTTALSEIALICNWKATPLMDAVFETGLRVTKVRWSIQAVEVIISELEGTGLSSEAVEVIKKKFYERLEW